MTNYYFNTKSKLKTKIKNINEKRNILKDIKENIQQKEMMQKCTYRFAIG